MANKSKSIPNKLQQAFNVEDFRTTAHEIIDVLCKHLKKAQNNTVKIFDYVEPEEEHQFWLNNFEKKEKITDVFQQILDRSINVQHPHYIGHQVSAPALVSALGGLMSNILSNGSAVYEMGKANTALEKVICDWLSKAIGYKNGGGFLTSGGTLANLTALLAARRHYKTEDVWKDGHRKSLAIMVSNQAHYCVDRAARIMGLGEKGIIKLDVDEQFKVKTSLLEKALKQAEASGFTVIALVGSACTTATGSFDDLEAMASFAKANNLWFHVDGAHGGPSALSKKYKHLVKGIDLADSVVIDFHKMMLTPSLTTALLFKNEAQSFNTFQQKAAYLWNDATANEWHQAGKRTFECTKLMMAPKIYFIIKAFGVEVFEQNIDDLYNLAKELAREIKANPKFELLMMPECNIVNFRYVATEKDLNKINQNIRQALVKAGEFYIVQSTVDQKIYLRCTVMNPLTTAATFTHLLKHIEELVFKYEL